MSKDVCVALLPELLTRRDDLNGATAIVVDVLRASTTIVHALAAGARAVVPCETVEQARTEAANRCGERIVLGGERSGELIDGFDLDNSPESYTRDAVENHVVVFTTTNGTSALIGCRPAEPVLIAAFVNLTAIVDSVQHDRRPLVIVCAGTDGTISAEDVLLAGAIVARLGECRLNDQARIAMDFFAANSENHAVLLRAMRASVGGMNLGGLGFDRDIQRAAEIDLFKIVPAWDSNANEIRIAGRVPHNAMS